MRWSLKPVGRERGWGPKSAPQLSLAVPSWGLAYAGAGNAAPEAGPGLAFAQDKTEGPGTGKKAPGDGKSVSKNPSGAQPSPNSGVPKSVATLVLDSSALGVTTAPRPELRSNAGVGARAEIDPESDAALMLRLAAGDEACFTILAEKYHRPMIHFLFRMVRNQAVAEELAQEVFLRVYRSRESYRDRKSTRLNSSHYSRSRMPSSA